MCVIIAKTRHIKSPTIDIFENAMDNNPDGFAVAHKRPGKPWQTFKTLSKSLMLKYIAENGILNKNSRWVFHARIKTHGAAELKNCHCWQDDDTNTIFAHNGILSITADNGKTDSETFYRHIFLPILRHEGRDAALKACRIIINGTSKMAIIFKKPKNKCPIALVGNWQKEKGIYYSNASAFRKRQPVYASGFWGIPQTSPSYCRTSPSYNNGSNMFQNDRSIEAEAVEAYWKNKAERNAKHLCNTQQPITPSPSQATRTSTENKELTAQELRILTSEMREELSVPWGS